MLLSKLPMRLIIDAFIDNLKRQIMLHPSHPGRSYSRPTARFSVDNLKSRYIKQGNSASDQRGNNYKVKTLTIPIPDHRCNLNLKESKAHQQVLRMYFTAATYSRQQREPTKPPSRF